MIVYNINKKWILDKQDSFIDAMHRDERDSYLVSLYNYMFRKCSLKQIKTKISVGDICYCDFGDAYQYEIGYQHLGVVISICNDIRVMRSTYLKCKDVAFCHNGIIRDYTPKSKLINDTQCFGIHVLDKFYELNYEFYKDKDICRMLKLLCKSKLCFLNSDGEIYYIGDFVDVKGNSCSNNYFTFYSKRRNTLQRLSH